MNIVSRLNIFVQEHLAFLCISGMVAGLLAGEAIARFAWSVPWLLALLTFSTGLSLSVRDLSSVRRRPWIILLHLAMLHGIMPLIAMLVSTELGFPIEAVMGFAILAMMPVSASCVVWTGIFKGNVTMSMALLLADTLLAPFIIPYVLSALFGTTVHLDSLKMLWDLFWMLLFPSLLGITVNHLTDGGVQRIAGKTLSLLSKLAIFAIVLVNGGVVAPFFHDFDLFFFALVAAVFCFTEFWYVLTFLLGCLIFGTKEESVALMMSSSLRGTATGVVIAMAYFTPLTTLAVVLSMLFQQPTASFAGRMAERFFDKRKH